MQHIQVTGVQSCSLLHCLSQTFHPERHCLAVLSIYKGDKSVFYLTYPSDDSPQCQCHFYGFLPRIYCQKHHHEIPVYLSYFVCYINPLTFGEQIN